MRGGRGEGGGRGQGGGRGEGGGRKGERVGRDVSYLTASKANTLILSFLRF